MKVERKAGLKRRGCVPRRQYAALPVRYDESGQAQVLLLTSRGTGRWIIPKGWPMPKLSPAAAAAREAYEEAGVAGTIKTETPIGSYRYDKWRERGLRTEVEVDVFLLVVTRQFDSWPEQSERRTRWCDPQEAAGLVDEPELAALLLGAHATAAATPP